jgi:hypothetical protein
MDEQPGELGDRKDEDEIEEQFQGRDPLDLVLPAQAASCHAVRGPAGGRTPIDPRSPLILIARPSPARYFSQWMEVLIPFGM